MDTVERVDENLRRIQERYARATGLERQRLSAQIAMLSEHLRRLCETAERIKPQLVAAGHTDLRPIPDTSNLPGLPERNKNPIRIEVIAGNPVIVGLPPQFQGGPIVNNANLSPTSPFQVREIPEGVHDVPYMVLMVKGKKVKVPMSTPTLQVNKTTAQLLQNKRFTNSTGKVENFQSPTQGNTAARSDFNALNPRNVRTYPNGVTVGDLSDGRVINLHPSSSSGGVPTLEIFNPITRTSQKIRY